MQLIGAIVVALIIFHLLPVLLILGFYAVMGIFLAIFSVFDWLMPKKETR